jgi:hypothetical protein
MRLEIELVPSSSWYNNVRSSVSRAEWNKIREKVHKLSGNKCEICGAVDEQLDCHEKWDFASGVQKLVALQSVCRDCHNVKHIGLAKIKGFYRKALEHLASVNQVTLIEAEKQARQAFAIWDERSYQKWKLDLSLLKDFGIELGSKGKR